MMNKYALIMMGAGCLLAAACQAASVRTEPGRNAPAAASAAGGSSAAPADQQDRKAQEHRRFKRLSLPLR